MTQQRGGGRISQSLKHSDQLPPGNIGNRLGQYKAAAFFYGQCLFCVHAGKKRGTVARMTSQRKLDIVRAYT